MTARDKRAHASPGSQDHAGAASLNTETRCPDAIGSLSSSAGARLLEAYAEGRDVDVPEWNKEVALHQFVRWSADDLKAFHLEARMQQKPGASFQELNGWLWSETELSNPLRAVRDRMRAQVTRS